RLAFGPDFERSLGRPEGLGGAIDGGTDLPGMEFTRLDRQRVAVHQVPGVASHFPLDVGDQPRRAVKAERLAPPQRDAQQPVEPDEVVHVRVRDERVHGAQQPSRAQGRVVAQVEEERALGPTDLDIQARVAERGVDEVGGKRGVHEAFCWAMTMLRCRPSWVARRTALRRNAAWNSAPVAAPGRPDWGSRWAGGGGRGGGALGWAGGWWGQWSGHSRRRRW